MTTDFSKYPEIWATIREKFQRLCRDSVDFEIAERATEEQVCEVESEIGMSLPCQIRDFFLTVSSKVSLDWYFEWDFINSLPESLRYVRYGNLFLSLEHQRIWWTNWEDWEQRFMAAEQYSPNRNAKYDFESLYPFLQADNGDTLVIVTGGINKGAVVFQSFEDADLQCARLASSFLAFLDVWSQLGCPGPLESAMLPFYDKETDMLSLDLPASIQWRGIVGVDEL